MNYSISGRIVFIIILLISSLYSHSSVRQQLVDSLNHVVGTTYNDSIKVYTLVNLSQVYSSNDIKSSIYYAEKAMDVAKENELIYLQEYAMFNAGNAYFIQGMFETATDYFYKYLDIQKENYNKPGIAYALANIGAIRLKMKDFQVAKKSFLQALHILESLPDESTNFNYRGQIPNILNNLGIAYQNLQQYDSSLYYFRKGLSQSHFVDDIDYFHSGVLNNIGGLFLDINKIDSAFLPISKAMEIRQRSNDLGGQAASHSRLSDYYFVTNQPKMALRNLYSGFEIASAIGSIDIKSSITEKIYKYYLERNIADSALKYLILNSQFNDTINNTKTLKELTRLELTAQFKEKQKIEQLEQKRLNALYMFTGVSLILVLLIFVLLYFLSQNRNRRLNLEKNNISLSAQNTTLENENLQKELELRNKELTTNVMSMIRKNELIRQIVEVLSAKKSILDANNSNFVNSVIKDLNNIQDESIWEEFEVRYQQVHTEFYDKLQKINSNITTNERRLCAFLRLDMTTKDIASITGQTLRSIEVARTRLRKKLQLTNSETSLADFLSSL